MSLAARTTRIAVSPTMKVAADAMRLKAQGIDVRRFRRRGARFPHPAYRSRRPRAIDAHFTRYTTTRAPTISSAPSSSATRRTTASTTRRQR